MCKLKKMACDTVWHDGLRKMLFDAKIPTKFLRIISNFLDNRYGQVRVNEYLSMKVPLTAGVPKGSILSPLLYNCELENYLQKYLMK